MRSYIMFLKAVPFAVALGLIGLLIEQNVHWLIAKEAALGMEIVGIVLAGTYFYCAVMNWLGWKVSDMFSGVLIRQMFLAGFAFGGFAFWVAIDLGPQHPGSVPSFVAALVMIMSFWGSALILNRVKT